MLKVQAKTNMTAATLSVADYVIFGIMLLASSVIGLYHGYQSNRKKEDSKEDYLLVRKLFVNSMLKKP